MADIQSAPPSGRQPLPSADQPFKDDEVRSSARKAAHVPGSKRNTSPSAALLSRTPMLPPARRAVSTHCPLLMLWELLRQPPGGLHSSELSPTGVLSPIYNPSVPAAKKLQHCVNQLAGVSGTARVSPTLHLKLPRSDLG